MFGKPRATTRDSSSVTAPLLSSSEPNDRLPHLTVPCPPSAALVELLQPLPKHLIVDTDNAAGGIMTLRHPADLLGLMGTAMHTVEDLRYCMDIYQLMSQRRLKRTCFPQHQDNAAAAQTTATTFLFQYTCCDKDCPFSLSYRRTRNPPAGASANQCELILPSDDDDDRDEYPQAHKCQPHSTWQQSVVHDDEEDNIMAATSDTDEETDASPSMRGSGYCASTALTDALVTRFLLVERRRQQSSNLLQLNLESYFDRFQQELGIQLSKQRFEHGCKLFAQVQRAWPHYRDEDASICDSVHGLWSVGILTKGLPNTMLQFVITGRPPSLVADPTASLVTVALPWAWYYVRRVGKFLALVVFIYTFGLVFFLGSGSIVVTGAIRGAAHWNQLVATMESSPDDVVEFDGWVSDRLKPLSRRTCCGRLMGCIYGQNHGAMTLVTYMEPDGADFTRKFIKTARFYGSGLDHVVEVRMKRLTNQWSHAFPSLAFSKKHGILSRFGFGAFGVLLWVYSFTVIPFWNTMVRTTVFGLLQAYFLWISWTCTPPAQPWEGIQAALWVPRGCHDYFSTMTQVLVFRVWAMSLNESSSPSPATPRHAHSGANELLPSNPSINIV